MTLPAAASGNTAPPPPSLHGRRRRGHCTQAHSAQPGFYLAKPLLAAGTEDPAGLGGPAHRTGGCRGPHPPPSTRHWARTSPTRPATGQTERGSDGGRDPAGSQTLTRLAGPLGGDRGVTWGPALGAVPGAAPQGQAWRRGSWPAVPVHVPGERQARGTEHLSADAPREGR